MQPPLWGANGIARPLDEIPTLAPDDFRRTCIDVCGRGARIAALGVLPGNATIALLADDARGRIGWLRMRVPEDRRYPSLSIDLPQAQAFEREIWENHGIDPEGHPWLKPLRNHDTPYPFFRVEGSGIHEVAVGPVHAGVIEPGHFRFQCQGENVLHLEIRLGYQHRGVEELMVTSSPARRLIVAESIAGDTVIGHAQAHVMALEALGDIDVPLAAQSLRGIAIELERLANHVGDLGALCNDVGYLPGASWFGRLRGEFLNMLMEISGNRFGRGLVIPGGARFGIDDATRENFLARLAAAERDMNATAEMTFDTSTICSRFEQTGVVTRETAEALGLVGPAARASGCDRDVRRDHSFGPYRFASLPVSVVDSGDVMARAMVRLLESQRSIGFLRERLAEDFGGNRVAPLGTLRPRSVAAALVEGWRGEIVHIAMTGDDGALAAYKIVDPSFHNWFGLAMAMRDGQISDFPLCNKSFNLSYAGHDL